MGWLFLREDFERLTELVSRGLGLLGEMDEEKETHHAV